MSWNNGIKTFKAGEALAAKRRVKLEVTSVIPPEVVYADAGEDYIGVTEYAVADGALVAVKLNTYPGTFEIECDVNSSIAIGTVLYGYGDGKVSDASNGTAQGIALEAGVDNSHIECAMWNVKSTTAATVSILDTDNHTSASSVEAAFIEIYKHILSAQKSVQIPLQAITQEDGTAMAKQTSTVVGIEQLSNKEQVITIPVGCTDGEELGFSVALPQDLDDSEDISIHVLVGKDANNDSLTLDCEVFPVAAGDLANADIQDTGATAIVEAGTELTFVCGADGVPAAPSAITVVLLLGGTNSGDKTYIYAVWVEYKAKVLTS